MSDFNRDKNRAVWFDIYVADLERAVEFYRAVLAVEISIEDFNGMKFAVIAHDDGNGGCIVVNPDEISDKGLLLYLNTHGRIRDAVEQVKSHGGSVKDDVHGIGPHGFRAIVIDSEGNRIALHSETDA